MKTLEICQQITGHYYELKLEDGNLVIEATDFSRELSPGLMTEIKTHKPELISLLRFQEEADVLLLESTRRIAQAWPRGFDLDTDPRWRQAENELYEAYFSEDLDKLRAVIDCRERLALRLFEVYRKQAAA